ncbi:topoisomerase II-associated protein PAT1 [Pisolithus croceorrhizus]|nr:topoisomerase II-associated protein PAT1 [Pisolithus croceorrhizus]
MSFFGFATSSLEEEKKKFLEGGLQESEDLAVYTWGDDSYDGLGDVLVEGADELNDETFGGVGEVGKDFDFTKQTLPDVIGGKDEKRVGTQELLRKQTPLQDSSQLASKPGRIVSPAGASIWDDNSPFSSLTIPRTNGTSRPTDHQRVLSVSSKTALPSHALADHRLHDQQIHPRSQTPVSVPRPISRGVTQTGARTLQEIEAEMRLAAQQARQRQELELRQQVQLQQERELRLAEQEQQQERLLVQQLQQQQQHELQLRLNQHQHPFQQQPTPPPRMVHHAHAQLPRTQSPRFHHSHQQQILMLQQEQERQQQERLKDLQERLRMEEVERQLRAQSISHIQRQPSAQARRQTSYADLQALQQRRTHSPATHLGGNAAESPLMNQHNAQFLPQNIQLQQRLLSEMAQAEFMRDVQGISQVEQEALRAEAMRKIMETERMEEKRRRKAAKIAHMSRYNDLMTQSDKDFITRIQVSQLVTQDPYADDFYAQVYGAILRSRMGLQSGDERVLNFGSSGGVGLGLGQRVPGRRQSAMQKMESQVERIVSNARLREKEKGLHSLQSLQGALGKTAGRSYKAAPRQLLQVDASTTTPTVSGTHPHISKDDAQPDNQHSLGDSNGAAREAAKMGREALGDAAGADGIVRQEPLTHRQVLVALEALYDLVLSVEQLRRDQPPEDDPISFPAWSRSYDNLVEQIWIGLKVLIPLETSDPHPFTSLLTPIKGKKLLPRLSRHIPAHRLPTLLTLLVACFSQLDVVAQAYILDTREDSPERQEVERQTAAFLGSVLQSILPVVARAELRLVTGLLGLLLDRSDVIQVAQTRPGIAILTLFLSRVEIIKQGMSTAVKATDLPTPEEAQQWQLVFDHFFQLLMPYFPILFPSTRFALLPAPTTTEPAVVRQTDLLDQPVWQFLAAVALHASPDQQSTLVAGLRDKVLENVSSVQKGWITDEDERSTKLANVNLFLHALGLDSSQITV